MLISIITVTYNASNCIGRLIGSLEQQTVNDFEWLVVDGGSSDETVQMVKSAQLERINVSSESDSGIYDAMNKGIDRASGDWLLFINADDQLYGDALSRAEEILIKLNSDVQVACFSSLEYDDQGNFLSILDANPALLYFGNSIPHPSAFIRRSFMKINKYESNYKIAADYYFFLKVKRLMSQAFFVSEIVLSKHFRGGQSSNQKLSLFETHIVRKKLLGRTLASLILVLIKIKRSIKYLKISS